MALPKVFDVLTHRTCGWLALAGVFIAGACGGEPPQRSLQQVMYDIDFQDQRMRAALTRSDLPTALEAGTLIRTSLSDAAFARYLERPGLPASEESFAEYQSYFTQALDDVLASARAGDAGGAFQKYARMRMGCEICHRDFRPGL